ncbi:MAG: hypothetical protein ACUVUC_16880 [Thermoguttaceae bacterium]
MGAVLRWDTAGGKEIRLVSLRPDGWRLAAMPELRPLYRLAELFKAPADVPVFVCEGEKAADAACRCGLVATTSAGGARAASKTDWSPLAGHRVVTLPDNDEAGQGNADDVAELAYKAPAREVRILRLADYAPALPAGGDLADVLAAEDWCGLPLGDAAMPADLGRLLLQWADKAEPWQPKPPADLFPSWEPYPIDPLPEPIRRFLVEESRGMGCEPVMLALPLLAALGAAIGTTRRIAIKPR